MGKNYTNTQNKRPWKEYDKGKNHLLVLQSGLKLLSNDDADDDDDDGGELKYIHVLANESFWKNKMPSFLYLFCLRTKF